MHFLVRFAVIWAFVLASALAGPPAQAQETGEVELRPDDLSAWLDGYMPYAMTQANIAGAVVVVVDRDGIVFQQGYGLADVAAGQRVIADETLFRPGSINSTALLWLLKS